jgi:hypothetical protein
MNDRITFRMVQTGSTATFELIVDGRLVASDLKIAEDIHPAFLNLASVFRYWLPQRDGAGPALKG